MWAQALLISSLALLKRREKQRHTLPYPPPTPAFPKHRCLGLCLNPALRKLCRKCLSHFKRYGVCTLEGKIWVGKETPNQDLCPWRQSHTVSQLRPRARQASLEQQMKSRTLCKNGERNHFPTDEMLKCQYFRYTGLNHLNCFHCFFPPLIFLTWLPENVKL